MTSPEKNGVKTLERLIWFDYYEQCGYPQVTASAHKGHQRRTEKDEVKKKAAGRAGTGTTRQPTNLPDEEPDYSNTAIQGECTYKRLLRHGTQSGQTRQEKRISQRPPNVINP